MAASPQTFRVSRGVRVEAAVVMAVGTLLLALVLIPLNAGIRSPMLLLASAPGLLLIGRGLEVYRSAAPKSVDEDGVWIDGPFGRRGARWSDVVGYDVLGTEVKGVRLLLRDGRAFALSYRGHEDDALYETVRARLAELAPFGVEGRVFRQQGRWTSTAGTVGILAFFVVAFAASSPDPLRTFWIPLVLMGPVFVPLTLWGVTDHAVLEDGILAKGSIFGTTRLRLADVVKAELKTVRRRHSGTVEKLVLTGREDSVTLEPSYDGYAILRDAVVAELRPSVRPLVPGQGLPSSSAARLRVESARPQPAVEGHIFRSEALGSLVRIFVFLAFLFGLMLWIAITSHVPAMLLQPGLGLLVFATLLPSAAEYAVLRGETLTVFSRLRKRQIPLAEVRRAEFRTVTRGSARRECLFLQVPDGEVEIPARLHEGHRLVDAIVRALPKGVLQGESSSA